MIADVVAWMCYVVGIFFFLAGLVGLVRFPDIFSRLHAVTKADNLGLGFLLTGYAVQSADWIVGLKLLLIWIFVLVSSALNCYLIASAAYAREKREQP